VFRFFDDADDGDGWRRINRTGRALVVERAIAAGDGRIECLAGISQAAHGFLHLPEQFRFEWTGHVEVVGRAQRHRAGAGQVACGFSDHDLPPSYGSR